MRAHLAKLKAGTEDLNYGREIIAAMAKGHRRSLPGGPLRVLDLGLGTGADLEHLRAALSPEEVHLFGVDSYEPNVSSARERGVTVATVNIEREPLPYEDGSMDLVVANQVLEHTKEIFWIVSEVCRVLKPGGAFIVGVPNLGSLHSRIMLLLGMQPSPIDVLGPHVRGFTKGGLVSFITEGGFFDVIQVKGANFYPFPRAVAKLKARLFPTFAVSLFLLCERTQKEGRFIDVLDRRFFETPFFRGTMSSEE